VQSHTGHLPADTVIQSTFDPRHLSRKTVAVVLAGGKGTRLGALTRHECKPALPFGAFYRNIDFSLSNCVNSGIHRIGVATQYQDASLIQHLSRVWRHAGERGEGFVEPWRAQRLTRGGSYRGTADAVLQNWDRIEVLGAEWLLVLAGDHVYQMDYRPMLACHAASGADVTVGCVEIPIGTASEFGVMSIDDARRVVRFTEKPSCPQSLPGRPDRALGSMGIYVFNRRLLARLLRQDALAPFSSHDFGHDLLPGLIGQARVIAYPFTRDATVGGGYWRDVGTIAAYWRAHMELLDGISGFQLDDARWPLRSEQQPAPTPPANEGSVLPAGNITQSLVAGGCRIEGATVHHSVLFGNVSIAEHSDLSNAVVCPDAVIGRYCTLRDVIVASGVRIPDGTTILPALHPAGVETPTLVTAEMYSTGDSGKHDRKLRGRAGRWGSGQQRFSAIRAARSRKHPSFHCISRMVAADSSMLHKRFEHHGMHKHAKLEGRDHVREKISG